MTAGRLLLLLVPLALPAGLKRAYCRRVLGWRVGSRVRIGLSFIDATAVDLGDDVRIGHFNVVRHLAELTVGAHTYVANFNQMFGASRAMFPACVRLGRHVKWMSHHFADAAGTVVVGDGATVGGRDTHLWTHTVAVDPDGGRSMVPLTVTIGPDAYVGARATLVGCDVPAGAFVGAGSVVTKSFPADPDGRPLLIAGNPATVRKTYPPPPPPPVTAGPPAAERSTHE